MPISPVHAPMEHATTPRVPSQHRAASPFPAHPASRPVRVRPATTDDLVATARLHIRDLPGGLFFRLGPRFVARWHRTYVTGDHGVALVATLPCHKPDTCGNGTADHVVGFLVGSLDRRRHVDDVLDHRRVELCRAGALALLTRPAAAVYFLRTRAGTYARRLRSRRRFPDTSTPPADPPAAAAEHEVPVAELTAVAVSCTHRGRGVGAALVAAFVEQCDRTGVPSAELVTGVGAGGAAHFYRRAGWEDVGVETARDGSRLLRLRRRAALVASR